MRPSSRAERTHIASSEIGSNPAAEQATSRAERPRQLPPPLPPPSRCCQTSPCRLQVRQERAQQLHRVQQVHRQQVAAAWGAPCITSLLPALRQQCCRRGDCFAAICLIYCRVSLFSHTAAQLNCRSAMSTRAAPPTSGSTGESRGMSGPPCPLCSPPAFAHRQAGAAGTLSPSHHCKHLMRRACVTDGTIAKIGSADKLQGLDALQRKVRASSGCGWALSAGLPMHSGRWWRGHATCRHLHGVSDW